MREASIAAPGVSPWTQIVSISRAIREPSIAVTTWSRAIETARLTTVSGSSMTAPGSCRGTKRAIGPICAVSEPFTRGSQARASTGREQL